MALGYQDLIDHDELRHDPVTAIILDLDASDDPLHEHQEGRFLHGYGACPRAGQRPDPGDNYCYLPLYIFCGRAELADKPSRLYM